MSLTPQHGRRSTFDRRPTVRARRFDGRGSQRRECERRAQSACDPGTTEHRHLRILRASVQCPPIRQLAWLCAQPARRRASSEDLGLTMAASIRRWLQRRIHRRPDAQEPGKRKALSEQSPNAQASPADGEKGQIYFRLFSYVFLSIRKHRASHTAPSASSIPSSSGRTSSWRSSSRRSPAGS